ncbi:MAG: hypothetical protein NC113_00650 [Bacteroides sp.]|nr:hypothetical protein [Bacteroides sp.]MCM1446735.1 hypothetical protein [Bacteroides sp.]
MVRCHRLAVTFALVLLVVSVLQAQVTVNARLDSVQFYVGQQDGLELSVTMPVGKTLQLPPFRKGMEIISDVEIVDVDVPDTVSINDGKQLQITQRYVITAWDSSFYYLPPLQVKVDTAVYETKSLAFKVYTLDVDTLNADVFFPPRDIQQLPFSWDDWKEICYASLLIPVLIGIIVLLHYLIKRGKPIFRLVRRKKKLPAHQVAISEIERIKEQRTWAKEDSKEYYTLLTDTLRTYIQERYGFSAMEMTSTEIIERLIRDTDQKSIDELREIFRTADLVKFAKWTTQINENDANLMAALQYVNETKVEEEPNARPEPEVVKETDKTRQMQVGVMRVLIGLMLLGIVVIVGTIAMRLYEMFY